MTIVLGKLKKAYECHTTYIMPLIVVTIAHRLGRRGQRSSGGSVWWEWWSTATCWFIAVTAILSTECF